MPVQYSIDSMNSLVISSFSAPLTCQDVVQFCHDLENDLRFEPEFSQIHEVHEDAFANMHFSDMDFLRRFDPFSARSRRAIVAHSNADYGMARMYGFLHGDNLKVFRSVESAERFLKSGSV